MTLQRDGQGTARYEPPSAYGGNNADALGLARPAQYSFGGPDLPPGAARWSIQKLDKSGNIYYWRLEIYDLRGGWNAQRGRFPENHNRLAGYSTALTSGWAEPTENGLILPELTSTTQDSSMSFTNGFGAHWANVGGVLVMGQGGGLNHMLFKETSTTDPTPTPIAYTATSRISAMASLTIGNGTSKRLAVFYGSDNGDLFDDLTPTVNATTFNTELNDCRGAIQTFLNNQTILFLVAAAGAGNQFCIKTLTGTSAINAAPTTVLSNVPANGYALGMMSLGGGPVRAWWVWGETRSTSVTSVVLRNEKGHITSTNLQGTDPQELFVGLPYIYDAVIVNNGIAASDGKSIRFHNGRFLQDLAIFRDRQVTSDREYRVAGLGSNGDELIAEINYIAANGVTANTLRWLEVYNFNLGAWRPVGQVKDLGATGIQSAMFAGGLPVSENTRFTQSLMADKTFYRKYLPLRSVNPYSLRKTNGATAGTGIAYAPSAEIMLPAMQIPGLEGWGMAVRRISGNPQLDIGGGTPTTYPSVELEVGGVSATFVYGQEQGRQEFQFLDNENVVYELQPVITLTQQAGGTDPTRTTPQALPLIIEGIARRPEFEIGTSIGDWTR